VKVKERFDIVYLDGQEPGKHHFMQERRLCILGLGFCFPCGSVIINSNYNKARIIILKITSKVH